MYRDSANSVDESDRAVGAILIGEALVDEWEHAVGVIRQPHGSHHARHRKVIDLHDKFPEIWRHLDRARSELALRGANTMAYDEMRPHARNSPTNAEGTDVDSSALQDARRAIEDLKLAVPGADWKAIRRRTEGLVEKPLGRSRGQRGIMFAFIFVVLFAISGWFIALLPVHKEDPRVAMRREIRKIQHQRKARIPMLTVELGQRCDLERARELTKLLAMDGRTAEARIFGMDYMNRCGDDEVVDNWAHAPRPPQR